ncbi:transketolase family protein [Lutispora saccharofermentans]|uniref:Transketolase family protein n=1 Tax=Lutispora saccharofermentans TaxID=3024236 RepID=A0ABT1NJK3_9FIRM|nr:transketolase family protein [Lutispora saccharofermentans]MCQ1531458.1 transketolase family protein [Lutispora saccharofermentans]
MGNIATREAYGAALAELGEKYKNVVVLDADLSKSTKTHDFKKKYPDRFFNMGISEQDLIGTAAGFATCGKIPFASTFAMFATGRAFEQIRNSIAYPRLNVKIAATHAGITLGEDGASHQAIEDVAIMRAVPNMTIVNPADALSARKAIEAAIQYNGPMYIRLGRLGVPEVYKEDIDFTIGKGILVEEGKDVTIIAAGFMVHLAIEASAMLKEEGISAEVIDMHTIKPIDKDLIIGSAKKTGAIVTAEEHNIIGGLGGAVAEVLCEEYPVPVVRVGIKDVFGQSGKPMELVELYGISAKDIAAAARQAIAKK